MTEGGWSVVKHAKQSHLVFHIVDFFLWVARIDTGLY